MRAVRSYVAAVGTRREIAGRATDPVVDIRSFDPERAGDEDPWDRRDRERERMVRGGGGGARNYASFININMCMCECL